MDAVIELGDIDEVRDVREVGARALKIYSPRLDPFHFRDWEFKKRYRFSKVGVENIINLIGADLGYLNNNRGLPIRPELQVLTALRIYREGFYQLEDGDLHGLSQPTVCRVLQRVSVALARKRRQIIKFPTTLQEQRQEMIAYHRLSGFPRVIGCVDGTHIRIPNPGGPYAQTYINRKGWYSLNVQIVCGADLRITNIVARWRGSAHDSRIFRECNLKERFENREFNGLLLGDSGYPATTYLLTPVLNPQNIAEEAYNYAQIRTRNTVERTIGLWKMVFRSLHRGLTTTLRNSKAMIVAMAVLHNLRINYRLDEDSDDSSESDEELDYNDEPRDEHNDIQLMLPVNRQGNAFRINFINAHFRRE